MNKKSILKTLLIAASLMCCLPIRIYAETGEPDYSDTAYWNSLCSNITALSSSQESACKAYLEYTASQSEELSEQLSEIQSQSEELAEDTEAYDTQIAAYQRQVDYLNEQIAELDTQIAELQEKMEEDRADIDELKDKVTAQMEVYQSTMRLSTFVDVLAGAKSFADLLRIASGLSSITQYHYQNLTELTDKVNDLQKSEEELENSRNTLLASQDGILMMQYAALMVKEEYEQKQSETANSSSTAGSTESSTEASSSSTAAASAETGKTDTEEKTSASADPAPSSQTTSEPKTTPTPVPAATPTPTPAPTPTPTPEQTAESGYYKDTEASAEGIYGLLTRTYGFTKAAACGILANIYIESRYNPASSSYGNYYYGLCQWGGGRQDNLFEFCEENGYPSDSVNGQIAYMYLEMDWYSMIDLINSYENSADGAADAGVYFRTVFERSAGLNNVASIAADLYDSF